jgi:hypothetical protein
MTCTHNILLITKTARTSAVRSAMAGVRTSVAASAHFAGFDQDHNCTVLADRGAG